MFTLYVGNYSKQFLSWWELIRYIKSHDYDTYYAHNSNDCYVYGTINRYRDSECELHYYSGSAKEARYCIAYDENGIIINLAEIRSGFREYREQPEPKYHGYRSSYVFEYRREPVPNTGKGHSRYWKIPKHTYRSSWIKAVDNFQYPKAKEYLSMNLGWYDEYPRRPEKNWKSQGKKRHQWSKND